MQLAPTAIPQPLPGKPQPPAPNPAIAWIGVPLVKASMEYAATATGAPAVHDLTYAAMSYSNVDAEGNLLTGSKDILAFERLSSTSLQDAVEAASQVAATRTINLNFGLKDSTETTASTAVALMQAADGAFYATSLNGIPNGGTLTVDTGRANFRVLDVSAVNPDVRAVVGAHSWVNFTDESITPRMAR